jgi:NAD(P)-dependent dehydrogenase (short-subunit alcohol dehydrogenase family)
VRQVTVVTGGGRGIGAATVQRLAAAGHDVAIAYHRDVDAAEAVGGAVRAAGRRAVVVRADVASEADVERLFDTAIGQLGPVTGLVNNAGVTSRPGPLVDLSTEDLRRVVDVNLLGSVLCARRAAQEMATTRGGAGGAGGAIVNVSSGAATLGSPGEYVHYAATKAAVDTLTIGLAKELAADGIRVNCVQPGLVHTGIHATMGDPQRPQRLAPGIPLGRAGEPDEIAAAICWLLSPEASYATGAILRVAGGR